MLAPRDTHVAARQHLLANDASHIHVGRARHEHPYTGRVSDGAYSQQELEEVGLRTGCSLRGVAPSIGALPVFVHEPSGQEFVLVPGGNTALGMQAEELLEALAHVRHDPRVAEWARAHRARFEAASPVRVVRVGAFLLGRSPVLGRTVDLLRGVPELELVERDRA